MTLAEYKNAVCQGVVLRLKGCKWFKGVCMDTVKESYEAGKPLSDAIDVAEMDTVNWDRPGGLLGP